MEESGERISCSYRIEDILEVVKSEIASSKDKRSLPAVVLLLVDIDNLERINRWYGRSVGNEVLEATSKILKKVIGPKDLLVRFGGDEFLILLRDTTLKEAKEKARQILSAIKTHEFASHKIRISVSIGIAHYFSFAFSTDEFIGCVVEALTLAQKEVGTFKVFMEEEEWNEE
ncbi:MAG: GGDEF domain-containing protein [Candidatus Omnitrophota bacterium]|nr:GGDEF domain-containing protein [Candidatus Omnitrophota bacterium]